MQRQRRINLHLYIVWQPQTAARFQAFTVQSRYEGNHDKDPDGSAYECDRRFVLCNPCCSWLEIGAVGVVGNVGIVHNIDCIIVANLFGGGDGSDGGRVDVGGSGSVGIGGFGSDGGGSGGVDGSVTGGSDGGGCSNSADQRDNNHEAECCCHVMT